MKYNRWLKVILMMMVLTLAMGVQVSAAEKTGLVTEDGVDHIYNAKGELVKSVPAYQLNKNYYSVDSKGTAVRLLGVKKLAAQRLVKLKAGGKKSMKNLKKAFAWSASLTYRSNTKSSLKGEKAAEYYGTYGFKNQSGDCNTAAYTFRWMAQVLGYNKMTAVHGYVPNSKTGKKQKHTWCTMKIGKKLYYFDPDYNRSYAGKKVKTRKGTKKLGKYCGFKFTYGTPGTFVYKTK